MTYGIFNDRQFKQYCERDAKGWGNEGWIGYNRTDGLRETWEPVICFWVNKDKKIVPVTHLTNKVDQSVKIGIAETNPYHLVGELDHQLFTASPSFVKKQFGESYDDITLKLASYTEESLINEFVKEGPLALNQNGTNCSSGFSGHFIDSSGRVCSM